MNFGDLTTLISLGIAVFVFWRLRSVLGQRTGHQGPPPGVRNGNEQADADASNDNVVTLPNRRGQTPPLPEQSNLEVLKKFAEPGTELHDGLKSVMDADQGFDPEQFLAGAKMAYEMTVTAFADSDTKTLKNLLSKEVYESFAGAIADRQDRKETMNFSFVGVEKAAIVGAEMVRTEEMVTVRFVSQIISATLDESGEVIDGDLEDITDVTDIWTFSRDSRSRDPNWKLVATESEM